MRSKITQLRQISAALKLGLIFITLYLDPFPSFAQSTGDFRTFQDGAWNDVNTWERFNGVSWINPAPGTPSSADGVITILATHEVNIPSGFSVTVDQVILTSNLTTFIQVDNGGTLILANGTGNDMVLGNTFTGRGRLEIAGIFRIEQGAVITNATSTRLIVESGGTYRHNYTTTAGVIYNANWNSGSTLEIMGYTTNAAAPTGLGQAFQTVNWNCTNMAADIDLNGTLNNIGGDLNISSTGSVGNGLILSETQDFNLNVTGNMTIGGDAIMFISGFTAANVTVNIGGDFTNNATSALAPSGLTGGDGNVDLNITGDFVSNFDFFLAAGGTGIGTVKVEGNFSHNAGVMEDASASGAGALEFSGTSLQLYSAAGSYAGKIHFTINTDAIVSMGTSTITGTGNFTLNNSAEIRIGSSAGIVNGTGSGNIRVSGTRTFGSTSTIVYNGSSAQVTGNGLPASVYILTINNASNVTLSSATTVSNILSLQSGKIILGSINLTIAATGSISGTASSRYIVTSGTGTLTINSVGNSNVVFPIGLSTSYNPVTINNSGTIDNISARVFSGTIGGANIVDVVNRTWDLSEAVANGSSFTITLQWNSAEEGANFDRNNCGVGHFTGGSWSQDNLAAAQGSDPYTEDRSGLTSFGQFGVGDDLSPLPVKLISFSAALITPGRVDLAWATASEQNNEYFDVEFSTDGNSWISHGTEKGGGTTVTNREYKMTDNLEQKVIQDAEKIYYRLKQVDFDGQFDYSAPVPVKLNTIAVNNTSTYPNPFSDLLTIVYEKEKNDKLELNLMGQYGNSLQSSVITDRSTSGTTSMPTQELPFGLYILRISNGNSVEYRKIIKQ